MVSIKTRESPFTPGKPVPVEYFVARIKEIERLERAIRQASTGRNENIFIMGERGIGKSSLASFVRYLAEKEYSFIGAHCFLGGTRSVEEIARTVFQRLFQEVSDKTIFERLKGIFGKFIKGITLFGIGVEFTTDNSELRMLLDNFLPLLNEIFRSIKDTKKGLVLILDDLNGITGLPQFSQFLKSFVDELATSREPIPLLLILVGLDERREEMVRHQPSVARVFDIIALPPMSKKECGDFFTKMFGAQNISIDPEALSRMVEVSGGLPMLMHEIGDAVFWKIDNDTVGEREGLLGILSAAESVGKKYLDQQVYDALRSDTYRSLLRRLGKLSLGLTFQRKSVLREIPEKEQKTFDNFLRRMRALGVIAKTQTAGEYKFTNELYHLYVALESIAAESRAKA